MSDLRAAVIGLGVGEQHIAGLEAHPRCRVTVLCDRDPAVAARMRERYPDKTVTEDPGEVLRGAHVDVVSIATHDDAHAAQILLALEHGKHVFVEKPLCLREDDAKVIRGALRAHPEMVLSSNLILRQSPRFARLRDMVCEGVFGELFYVEGDYDYGRLHKLTEGWRGTLPDYSVMLGGGVHLVDLLLWLMVDEVVEVMAYGNRLASGETPVPCDDLVAALLKFKSGAVGKITVNFGVVRPHFHPLKLCGTRATFLNGPDHGLLYTSRDPAVAPEPMTEPYPGVAKGALLTPFVEAVLGQGPPPVSADDVFRCLSVCFAVDRSLKSGQPQVVEPL